MGEQIEFSMTWTLAVLCKDSLWVWGSFGMCKQNLTERIQWIRQRVKEELFNCLANTHCTFSDSTVQIREVWLGRVRGRVGCNIVLLQSQLVFVPNILPNQLLFFWRRTVSHPHNYPSPTLPTLPPWPTQPNLAYLHWLAKRCSLEF